MSTRIEHDRLGDEQVPQHAWYGIQTLRALRHFHASHAPLSQFPDLIHSYCLIKETAAGLNYHDGKLSLNKYKALLNACNRIKAGELHDQFVVDIVHGDAISAINTNCNEVITNLALTEMGLKRGQYYALNPNKDCNRAQHPSENYQLATRISLINGQRALMTALESLIVLAQHKEGLLSRWLQQGPQQLDPGVLAISYRFAEHRKDLKGCTEQADLLIQALGQCSPEQGELTRQCLSVLANLSSTPLSYSQEGSSLISLLADLATLHTQIAQLLLRLCEDIAQLHRSSSLVAGSSDPWTNHNALQTALRILGQEATAKLCLSGPAPFAVIAPMLACDAQLTTRMLVAALYNVGQRCIRPIKLHLTLAPAPLHKTTASAPPISYDSASYVKKQADSSALSG